MKQLHCIRATACTQKVRGLQKNAFSARPSSILQVYAHLLVNRLTLNSNKPFQNVTAVGLLSKGAKLKRSSFFPADIRHRELLEVLSAYKALGFKHTVSGGVGLSRLLWYTVIRLIRQQRLALNLKGVGRTEYDQTLAKYANCLTDFEHRQSRLLKLNSQMSVATRRMYL